MQTIEKINSQSVFQANSLFSLKAYFKDNNKFTAHSWKQEIRTKDKLIDHKNAYLRLYDLATKCSCAVKNTCFYCNHKLILIYCNITEDMIFKSAYGLTKHLSELKFSVIESGEKKHILLNSINEKNVINLAKNHSRNNWQFNKMNK